MTRLVNDYQFDECNDFEFTADALIAEDRAQREIDAFAEMVYGLDDSKLNDLYDALSKALDTIYSNGIDDAYDVWKRARARYDIVANESHERYVEANIDEFREYQKRYLERVALGVATPEEGDFYSDWHKDIYGFRPR